MKICPECGEENLDQAKFCRNCGGSLVEKPVEKPRIVVQNKPKRSLAQKIFYKVDKHTGKVRIAKARSVSIVVFVAIFIMAVIYDMAFDPIWMVLIVSVIVGLMYAVPVYVIGFIVGWLMDRLSD